MSTNSPGELGFGGTEEAPAGLPDPLILARMANEFFTAVSGAQPAAPESSEPAPAFSFPEVVRPRYPEPEEEAAALSTFLKAGQAPAVPTPPMPTFPGGLDSTALPAFSFLEEARPLFSYPPAAAAPVPALKLSSDFFDAQTIRRDFPLLREQVNGRPLVWLDNAATTQKPQSVIDRLSYFYEYENSNVHRAAHEMAARATDAYESAREKVRRFLNASTVREIIFVRGATEGINLVAQSWGRRNVQKDDEIVITWLEHHANIVPWQALCSEKGARLRVAPVDDRGQVILEEYEKLLGPRTRLVSIAQVSNALGTVTPLPEMIEAAHRYGARVLVDGAQAVSHMRVDVQALSCDFFVLSGHKMFAPTGIGVLYGRSDVLDAMPPWQGGGNMIQDVTFERTVYQPPPARFEAGTGNIADAVGLGAAIDYLDRVGMANISRYEHELLLYGTAALEQVPGLHIIGTAPEKAGVLSFVLDGVRTEEIGDLLNREGIAVRAGHHCAQPIHRRFGIESTVRASLALYNTCEDIDALAAALLRIQTARPGHGFRLDNPAWPRATEAAAAPDAGFGLNVIEPRP
ncbi:MAG: family 2A encapsulin nanocompartment cargo protein cysteine desulfurase [Bryobacteraceae bacterium]|jgi:cysteine desulfurase/selenocysteine lyase